MTGPAIFAGLAFLRMEKKCVRGRVRVSIGGLGMTGRGTDSIAVSDVSGAWQQLKATYPSHSLGLCSSSTALGRGSFVVGLSLAGLSVFGRCPGLFVRVLVLVVVLALLLR